MCIKAAGVEPGGCVGLRLPRGGCRCWWQVWGRLRRPQGVVLELCTVVRPSLWRCRRGEYMHACKEGVAWSAAGSL